MSTWTLHTPTPLHTPPIPPLQGFYDPLADTQVELGLESAGDHLATRCGIWVWSGLVERIHWEGGTRRHDHGSEVRSHNAEYIFWTHGSEAWMELNSIQTPTPGPLRFGNTFRILWAVGLLPSTGGRGEAAP